MKLLKLSFVQLFLLFVFSCQSATDSNINKRVKRVTLNESEVFEYQTAISGDEELAIITQQPNHYEISEIVRDSTTEWEAIYRYKPESGFQGTDQATIKLGTRSDGSSSNTNFELIEIEFTVD
jgi:hypothetical protein